MTRCELRLLDKGVGSVSKGIKGGRWEHAGFSVEDFENFFVVNFELGSTGSGNSSPSSICIIKNRA